MKKTYEKPAMAVEMFTLTQTIARACGVSGGVSTHWNESSCSFNYDGLNLFAADSICIFQLKEGDQVNGLCYNAPDGNVTAFSST